ncbi:hypothetical protein AHMF7605_12010 [Adhaeribacter arboris]|uniref:Uncharacterized protein n=1 Tax=Adhaeribacter arboris TaxID=2072846 RepID=A0A2T2YFA4_9BACT|nr:hypothetical protein [Adhaeribacter arboris]PSR54195.1 hypothetical protein AHMF7605_12010 [Adhaeribacter arboris]
MLEPQIIPGYLDPKGRQIFTGDVYRLASVGDPDYLDLACLWLPELYRYGWLNLEDYTFYQNSTFEEKLELCEGLVEITYCFDLNEFFVHNKATFKGNLFTHPKKFNYHIQL